MHVSGFICLFIHYSRCRNFNSKSEILYKFSFTVYLFFRKIVQFEVCVFWKKKLKIRLSSKKFSWKSCFQKSKKWTSILFSEYLVSKRDFYHVIFSQSFFFTEIQQKNLILNKYFLFKIGLFESFQKLKRRKQKLFRKMTRCMFLLHNLTRRKFFSRIWRVVQFLIHKLFSKLSFKL